MVFMVFTQVLYAAAWIIVIAASVIFLQRGYGSGAISTLLGAAIMLLSHAFHTFMAALIMLHVIQGYHGRYSAFIMQIPPLLGMLLFAVGFLQLARETSIWMENHRAGKE